MQIFVTVQLSETETINKSSSKLATDLLAWLGGTPDKDNCQAAITSISNAPPLPQTPP